MNVQFVKIRYFFLDVATFEGNFQSIFTSNSNNDIHDHVLGGDDGWWEGEIQGRVGLFPSLVVEPVLDTVTVTRSPAAVSPYKTTNGPEKLEIVEFDSVQDLGLSKVNI